LYGGITLTDGKIKGKVVTHPDATTTGTIVITGPGWRAKLKGPIDQAGFHAFCTLKGGPFSATNVPVLLAVQPGPTPPPGHEPPPPKNQLLGADATVVNGAVTISHSAVPAKFFGQTAGLNIEFPSADGQSVVHADPSTASLPA